MPSLWIKSRFANLRRYRPSGVFYANAKVNGKLVRKSLGTTSEHVARLRLTDLLAVERGRHAAIPDAPQWSTATLVRVWLKTLESKAVAERTRSYYAECTKALAKAWPDGNEAKARSLSVSAAGDGLAKLRGTHSASVVNGALCAMRQAFDYGVSVGVRADNPWKCVKRLRIVVTAPALPSTDSWPRLLAYLDSHRRRKPAGVSVRFLAFTGLRSNEARHIMPKDVDMQAGFISARTTKGGVPRFVPIIPDCVPVLEMLLRDHPGDGSRLLPIANPRRALASACRAIGIPPMSPHDLRHFFTTRCLESGVDVRTVAEWLGHKDGGALLLKRYAHLRDGHSRAMAGKVSFGELPPGGAKG